MTVNILRSHPTSITKQMFVSSRDPDGEASKLHKACLELKLEDALVALSAGNANARNSRGMTPLHCLFHTGNVSSRILPIAELLLDHGADINALLSDGDESVRFGTVLDRWLQYAESSSSTAIVGTKSILELLVRRGGRCYRNGTPFGIECGRSYLTSASSNANMLTLSALIQNHQQPPLATRRNLDMPFESMLLELDEVGRTALHSAKNIKVAKFLLEQQGDQTDTDGAEITCCSWVSRRMLIDTNKTGRSTPLQWAKQCLDSTSPCASQVRQETRELITYLESYVDYPIAVSTCWQRPEFSRHAANDKGEGPSNHTQKENLAAVVLNPTYNGFQRKVAEEALALLDEFAIREASYIILGFLTLTDIMARPMPPI